MTMSAFEKEDRMCVAILDDIEDDLQLATSALESHFDIQAFRTGHDLLKHLDQEQADLLLISADLAGDYSLSVLADIRNRWPKMPIIIALQNSDHVHTVNEHYMKLATASVDKPFDPVELFTLVKASVGKAPD